MKCINLIIFHINLLCRLVGLSPEKTKNKSKKRQGNTHNMELFSQRRWAQQSNLYGMLTCMCCIIFGFVINSTAYNTYGDRYSLHLLLLRSSMTHVFMQNSSFDRGKKKAFATFYF